MSRAAQLANAALRDGDIAAEDPRWLPIIEQCRNQMNASKLPAPAGLEPDGEVWMRHYVISVTGLIKWMIYWRSNRSACILLGYFVTNWLPDDRGRPKHGCRKKYDTHGKVVMVNHKVKGAHERPVKVFIDALGLPVPVPCEMWDNLGYD